MSYTVRDNWLRAPAQNAYRVLDFVVRRWLSPAFDATVRWLAWFGGKYIARVTGDEALGRNVSYSAALHVFVVAAWVLISVLPMFFRLFGCDAYNIPAGDRPKEKQQQKRIIRNVPFIFNPHSAVAYNPPKAEEIDLELEKLTAAATHQEGTGGHGLGGQGAGEVRFIRLKYAGGSWDEDMDRHSGTNMLREFNRLTGIPVAPEAEVKSIGQLAQFKKGKAPPFVYITGSDGIRISSSEAKILRKYLLEEGGMIFADNGGGGFHYQFRNMMTQVLQGVQWRWLDLPNDHPIYRSQYAMNGAPPLWHHSGMRALGIVVDGRLICFYHQGDIGDAWKDGHSGASPAVTEWAYKCGVNVIIFAVDQYQEFLASLEK